MVISRAMGRWYFALGLFLMVIGWGVAAYAREQTQLAGPGTTSAQRVWANGTFINRGSYRLQLYPGRTLFLGGVAVMALGAGMSGLAWTSLREEKHGRSERRGAPGEDD